MEKSKLIVEITAHDNYLAIELMSRKSESGVSVLSCDHPNVMGQMILDCKRIGVSDEAYALLSQINPSDDDIGNVVCRQYNDGTWGFGWLGGVKSLLRITSENKFGQGQWQLAPKSCFTTIENKFPEDAVKYCLKID